MDGINSNNNNYASKMDACMTKSMSEWFNGLSKEELLDYLAGQPAVTADTIREMLSTMNCVLAFDIRFSTASGEAVTDFHTK